MRQIADPPPTAAARPRCLDIFVPKPSSQLWMILPICLAGGLAPMLMNIMQQKFSSMSPIVSGILAVVAICGISLLTFSYHTQEHCAEIRKYAEKATNADVRSYVAALAHSVPRAPHEPILKEVVSALRKKRLAAVILRLWWESPPDPIGKVIEVPFEPIPLNEADKAFFELSKCVSPHTEAGESVPSLLGDTDEFKRRLKRIVKIPGSKIVMAALMMQLMVGGLTFIAFGVLDWHFLLSVLLILFLGFAFFRMNDVPHTSWWLVPGGLIRRMPRKRSASSEVHLFHHDSSVLLFRPHSKRLWTMIVSDAATFGTVLVSELEMDMALRAWLSPIPPPTVEKLVDLT